MSAADDLTVADRAPTKSARPAIGASEAAQHAIRSLVRCKAVDPGDHVLRNIQAVRDAQVEFLVPEDQQIWAFVDRFAAEHGHAPELQTVTSALRAQGQMSAADRMESLKAAPLAWGGDFALNISKVLEAHRVKQLVDAWSDAKLIATAGLDVGKGRDKRTLRGAQQAAQHLIDALREVATPKLSSHLSGEVLEDADDGAAEYVKAETDPRSSYGQYTGLKQMDEAIGGARVAELWIHAAYSGHLKTTFALNWAYNQSVFFHENVLYFSLEMPYRQVRRWIWAMHSRHSKFHDTRVELGLQRPGGAPAGLDYKKIRDAQLAPAEKRFFLEHVLPDLKDPQNGYGRIIVEAADPDQPDVTVDGLRGRAEAIYSKTPFASVYVDHATLLGARARYTSTTERLTDAMRDLKRFAMQFRRGQGIPLIALYQINREGLKEAIKRKEKGQLPTYDLNNLANAAEAERSADVVTASYLDKEYAERCRALFTCLKSRDNAPFDPFFAEIDWPCRRLLTCTESPVVDRSNQADPTEVLAALAGLTATTQRAQAQA